MSGYLDPLVVSLCNCIKAVWNNFTSYKLPEVIPYPIDDRTFLGDIKIPLGINTLGNIQYLNIGGETSHSYIVGQTGSGKSNITQLILSTLVNNYPKVKLILLDYKRVELQTYSNTKNCIRFEWEQENISDALHEVYNLVLDRYDEMALKGENVASKSVNPIFVAIEEISLMPKQDMKLLQKILAISRACKIYFLITTQRPSNENISNTTKSLIGNRICLKTEDKKNSMISLDREGCELLRGKGHGYLKSGGYTFEFQAYYIPLEVVKSIVSNHLKPIKESKVNTQVQDKSKSTKISNENKSSIKLNKL